MRDDNDILTIVGAELQQSSTGNYTTQIDFNRETALDYYLGNLPGAAPEGRSQVISTDVADAIEWILPQIIKELTGKGPIVSFTALSEQDEEQALLETEYVHDCFMAENEGFLNLYQFVKDALLNKNGVFKIYYDDTPETTTENYTSINEQQMQMCLSDPDVELVNLEETQNPEAVAAHAMAMRQHQQQVEMMQQQMQANPQMRQDPQHMQKMQQMQPPPPPPPLFDIEVERVLSRGRVAVQVIPPEEFRINEYHNSLSPQGARFTAHVYLISRSDLMERGYDPEIIQEAPPGADDLYRREFRFAAQGEDATGQDASYSEDPSQDLIEVSECFMEIDLDDTGVSSLHKITVIGGTTPSEVLDIEPIEEIPFVSSSCIIMPHKFSGLSIYDRLKEIQDQKTSLWRNVLDNLYLQNNREKEVVEGQVNLDDLIISRPGGIKRVKAIGSIRELDVQPIGQEGFQMLDYLDTVRTGRVGVSPDTMGANMPVGETAHGTERLMTAKEELTGLMIRAVAETGLKPAYKLIRDLLIRHKDTTESFKFRGSWADVMPSQWGPRSRTSVNVGTGTGDDMRRVGAIQGVLQLQEKMLIGPFQAMVPPEQAFNAVDEYCNASGLPGAENYFLDPKSQKGQQSIQQMQKSKQEEKQKMDEMQAKIAQAQEQLAQAEIMKGQAALQSQQVKAQSEQVKAQSAQQKLEMEGVIASLKDDLEQSKVALDASKAGKDDDVKYVQIDSNEKIAFAKMAADREIKMLEMQKSMGERAIDVQEADKDRAAAKEQDSNDTDSGDSDDL